MSFTFKTILLFFVTFVVCSCGIYKQNIMFQVDEDNNYDTLGLIVNDLNVNYRLKPDDKITVSVYTGNGEMLIDPERKLISGQNANVRIEIPEYLVSTTGDVVLPLVGKVRLLDFTLLEVDSMLSLQYNDFYENSFVLTKCVNRRVTVLGALGGEVIPLANENVTLLEVLASAGGIDNLSKAQNIRLIRGDLSNPTVQVIDLSTIEGMKRASLKVETGDVIYVEPIRKVVSETIRDISPVVSLLTSVITLVFLISTARQQSNQ